MDVSLRYNRQMRSLTIAMGAAIFASVGAMFIPTAILESVTGATGLSEMIPATAAPLGDTARALIAFGAGSLTLAALAVVLLGTDNKPVPRVIEDVPAFEPDDEDEDLRPSLMARFANFRLPEISAPKWPWQKDDDDITEFADLPKLRGNDIHPDAPPRRPLSATADLPVLDLVEPQNSATDEEQPSRVVSVAPTVAVLPEMPAPIERTSSDNQPLIADMVAQLEAAVAQRQQQLKELEAVAARLAASQPSEPDVEPIADDAEPEAEILPEPVRAPRPPLEAVPSVPAPQDDMDEALAAALATLHRMNGSSGGVTR